MTSVSNRTPRRSRPATFLAILAGILVGTTLTPGHASPQVEVAGAQASVQTLVMTRSESAAAMVWDRTDVPLDPLLTTAVVQVIARTAPAGTTGFFFSTADEVALGVVVPRARQSSLPQTLEAWFAMTPSLAQIENELARLRADLERSSTDPLERAQAAVREAVNPADVSLDAARAAGLSAESIQQAWRSMARSGHTLVGVGAAGLARALDARLADRVAGRPEGRRDSQSVFTTQQVTLMPSPRDPREASCHAFVPRAQALGRYADAAPLVARLLELQLRERLNSSREPVDIVVGSTPSGPALTVCVAASPGSVHNVREAVRESLHAMRTLAVPEKQALQARQWLDGNATYEALDAVAALERFVVDVAWEWPPADRWEKPILAEQVREAAVALLEDERRVSAHVTAQAFGHVVAPQVSPATLRTSAPVERPAQDLLAALERRTSSASMPTGGYTARYEVTERTPTGEARFDVELEDEAGELNLHLETRQAGYALRLDESSMSQAVDPLPLGPDRMRSFAFRQPAVLVAAARAGEVDSEPAMVRCDDKNCPALRVRLDAAVVELVVTPNTHEPIELRTWWVSDGETRAPDELVRFVSWRVTDGVLLAEEMVVTDTYQSIHGVKLVDWSWEGALAPRS